MKLLTVSACCFLLAPPLTASRAKYEPPNPETNNERILMLEEFSRQQRDYNKAFDQHLTEHMDDLLRSQGKQNERIEVLERFHATSIMTETIVVWLLGVLIAIATTLFTFFYKQYRDESNQRHKENLERMSRLEDEWKQHTKSVANELGKLSRHVFFISGKEAGDIVLPIENEDEQEPN